MNRPDLNNDDVLLALLAELIESEDEPPLPLANWHKIRADFRQLRDHHMGSGVIGSGHEILGARGSGTDEMILAVPGKGF